MKRMTSPVRRRIGLVSSGTLSLLGLICAVVGQQWLWLLVVVGGVVFWLYVWSGWSNKGESATPVHQLLRQPSTTFDLDNSSVAGGNVTSSAATVVRGRNGARYDVEHTEHRPDGH